MEHRYTNDERMEQLKVLAAALDDFLPLVLARAEYSRWVPQYKAARKRIEELLQAGFEQTDLSTLSQTVPDLSHRDWQPLEQFGDGKWREPAWFVKFERRHQSVMDAAMVLRTLGYY
jgi:hypothetical protein